MSKSGYSGNPLWKKLGYKEGFAILTVNEPINYSELLAGIPFEILAENEKDELKDLIHFFTKSGEELFLMLPKLKKKIKQHGMIWVSWPKKSSKVPTDITEDIIRELALKIGLVDIKVCAVDAVWSALKLVIPVKDRSRTIMQN